MFEAIDVITLYAETPLHPGSGAEGGVVDLPVQRERHTEIPLIPATSIKGVLRDLAESKDQSGDLIEVFGPDAKSGDLHGGAFSPTDARLLLFPVRALEGIFVWVTCPFVIDRLGRDLELDERLKTVGNPGLPTSLTIGSRQAFVRRKSPLKEALPMMLEEEDYNVVEKGEVDTLATILKEFFPQIPAYEPFKNRLDTHLAVVSDSDFKRLVKTGTDVVTRIKLNNQKTTGDGGNMWVEEFLPSDCLFYSLFLGMPSRKNGGKDNLQKGRGVLDFVKKIADGAVIQIGGGETVGRGWMRVRYL